MCGIVGYIGDKKAVPVLLHGLSKLEYRGYDSAGVAVLHNDNINIVKTKGRLKALEEILENKSLEGSLGIGHTRWATHGAPSDINSHPHLSQGSSVAVVHNGIIENYLYLKEELEEKGYKFVSETDTETVAHLIDFYLKSGMEFLDAVIKAVDKIEGSYALGVICDSYPDMLIGVRKDSPLVVGLSEGENFIASDMPAILNYTKDIYLLEEREIAVVKKDGVTVYDRNKNVVKKEIFKVNWDVEAAEKGGFDHFMLKEIYEQPKVVKDTFSGRLKEDGIVLDHIDLNMENVNKIYMSACGTASYAAGIGKSVIESICRIPVFTDIASEFRYNNPIIDEKTLVIVVSQSGETADTLAALRLAKEKGAKTLAVVNVVGSSIAREADYVLYTVAGPEIAVASTKAFSAQIAAMYLLGLFFGLKLNKISMEEYRGYASELKELPQKMNIVLQKAGKLKELSDKYLKVKNVFYIGRGLDYLISLEGSLKLKEIAYIHSEPYPAGELKHGPIALIEESTLIVGHLTRKELFEKTISNLKECKARGAKVFAITTEDNGLIGSTADDVFYIPKTSYLFSSILSNIPQQLFAYYMASGLGNDVDKPRNLAKSVTVE
jgi:glucosamine--fructose-6-phosphate aminotransferase (isomerizing)